MRHREFRSAGVRLEHTTEIGLSTC